MWFAKASVSLLVAASSISTAFAAAVPAADTDADPEFPYTGSCSNDNCGAKGRPCRVGLWCVPYPTFEPHERIGCTCSYM